MLNEIAKQWFQKAKNDLLNADNNFHSEKIPYDTVCFHCQQAAEKLLKAFLINNNNEIPYTHDLLLLLEHILKIDNSAEELRDYLIILIPYAVEIRYPDDWFMPSPEDALEARNATAKVIKWFNENK